MITAASRPNDDLNVDDLDGPTPPSSNDDAVRLWLIDQTLQHLTRQQGILGLGANAVSQSLRAEREEIVARLQALGPQFESR